MGLVFTQMLFSFCLVSKISLPKLWTNNLSFHFFYLVVLIGYTACTHGPYTQGYATSAQGWFNACYGRQKIKGEIKLDYITLSPTPVVPHLSSINHGDVTHVRLLSNHAYSARELTVNQRYLERYPICTHTDSTINTRSTILFSHTERVAFFFGTPPLVRGYGNASKWTRLPFFLFSNSPYRTHTASLWLFSILP